MAAAGGHGGRGRPADPEIERRVIAAALSVYGEVGWAGFTLDRVARRAPAGKAALYRRWPAKEGLLLAALEHLAEPPDEGADPTDLRGCLIKMAEQVIDMFVGPKALVLPRLLIEASQYPPQFEEMVQAIVRARFGGARRIVRAAIDRGELPAGTPPDLIIDAVMGRVISLVVLTPGAQRAGINARRDHYAASITDFVLQALTREAVTMPGADHLPADPATSHWEAIQNLIATYAELVDAGDFGALGRLLADATFAGSGTPVSGPGGIEKMFRKMVIVYDDGTPRTKHITTNLAIDVDIAGGTAVARSYFTVLQALPDLALQPIVSGRYRDRFERHHGRWRFTERRVHVDLVGDVTHHLRTAR